MPRLFFKLLVFQQNQFCYFKIYSKKTSKVVAVLGCRSHASLFIVNKDTIDNNNFRQIGDDGFLEVYSSGRQRERGRITRRCSDETARPARGLTTVGNPLCWWWIRLEAFDADQILACVLSIGSPTPRHAAARRRAARFGKSYWVFNYGGAARNGGYIHTYIRSWPTSSFEMKLSALPRCTLHKCRKYPKEYF